MDRPCIAEMQCVGIHSLNRPVLLCLLRDLIERVGLDARRYISRRRTAECQEQKTKEYNRLRHAHPCSASRHLSLLGMAKSYALGIKVRGEGSIPNGKSQSNGKQ